MSSPGKYPEEGNDDGPEYVSHSSSSSSNTPHASRETRQHEAPPHKVSPGSAASPRRNTEQQVTTPPTKSGEKVEFALRAMLPSKWNVNHENPNVRREKNNLRLIGMTPAKEEEQVPVLVVTNKPIPMEVLQNIATHKKQSRRDFPGATASSLVHVYYFEVIIQRGITWVGLVPSKEIKGPVTLGRFPGDCVGSVGMSSDGRLYLSGQAKSHVSMTQISTSYTERDTIGCGLEVGQDMIHKVFFTKNGEMLLEPMYVSDLNMHSDWYFPGVALDSAGGDVFANFGLTYPFRWKGSEQHVLFSPDEVVEVPAKSPPRANRAAPSPAPTNVSPAKPPPGSAIASTWDGSPAVPSVRYGRAITTGRAGLTAPSSSGGNRRLGPGSWNDVSPLTASPGRNRSRQTSSGSASHSDSVTTGHTPLPTVTGASRYDVVYGLHSTGEIEVATKLPGQDSSLPPTSTPFGRSTNSSQKDRAFSEDSTYHQQAHGSFETRRQPRQPDAFDTATVPLPPRPATGSLDAAPCWSPRNSSHSENQSFQEGSLRLSASSGLYGQPSDKTIPLDDDFSYEDDTQKFLEEAFSNKAPISDGYSGRVGAHYVPEPAAGRVGAHYVNEPASNIVVLMDRNEIDEATQCASDLRKCCEDNDLSFTRELLKVCRAKQTKIVSIMQNSMLKIDDPAMEAPLNELMMLNDALLESIKFAENQMKQIASPVPMSNSNSKTHLSLPTFATGSLEIDTLVDRKDIFSLICMLRAKGDKRLYSALALMRFSRDAQRVENDEARRLRDETSSSGGMHSLLALFRSKGATRELKVVVSLAVAYLLPSFVTSSTLPSAHIGLNIIECLHFLFTTSNPVTPRGEEISISEMRQASIMGVHTFWFDALLPSLNSSKDATDPVIDLSDRVTRPSLRTRKSSTMQLPNGVTMIDQRKEDLELQELLELTVSLIVEMAKTDDGTEVSFYDGSKKLDFTPIVEQMSAIVQQMCTIDRARPIAVREGILKILVMWMRSQDLEKVRCASLSVNELTSTVDSYMAGWIHSQIVNEGALTEIVNICISKNVGQDVRLAGAKILQTLCIAPHTRAAVVESNCIYCLVSLLYEFSNDSTKKVAFAAGTALLQLLAGAMTRSSVFNSGTLDLDEAAAAEKKDDIISDIVDGGAISQFVAMARSSMQGKLRTMAIEAIRVLSEDNLKSRKTRLRLCEDGAAAALGRVLKDDVEGDGSGGVLVRLTNDQRDEDRDKKMTSKDEAVIKELHQALCAWANILDRDDKASSTFALSKQISSASFIEGAEEILVNGCSEFLETGGLGSLLYVATLPIKQYSGQLTESLDQADLVVEACRSLASLSPLLLSRGAAARGHAACSGIVLEALARALNNTSDSDGTEYSDILSELKFDALRGTAALANYEPHKLIIIDKYLPSLFHVKSGRGGDEPSFVSGAANQVCTSLGLAEDDFAKQIAGSDPNMIGDWFCMQRSLVIQSMARAELHKILAYVWNTPFQDILSAGLIPAGLGRASSKESASSSTLHPSRESSTSSNLSANKSRSDSGGEIRALDDVFEALAFEAEGLDSRNTMLQQYHDVYEMDSAVRSAISSEAMLSWRSSESETGSLLATHVYPLNSTEMEKDWILSHRQFMQRADSKPSSIDAPDGLVSGRVQQLLDTCIPSRLIQQDVLPIFDLRPESPFDFRSLMMPQRRYFSFRREGQLVAQLCDTNTSFMGSDDVYWTLGFTNSSFAGEFSETLVQSLYRCPLIRGISFTRDDNWRSVWKLESEEDQDNHGLLAKLAGSLPPTISSITFDNTLNDYALSALTDILETMGRLSASQNDDRDRGQRDLAAFGQKQGCFHSMAVKNSPCLGAGSWRKLFDLLGHSSGRSSSLKSHPLETLKVLDLSGNNLGDLTCSLVLKRALDKESGCSLESLDISRNNIGQGSHVAQVLRGYVSRYRQNQSAGIYVTKGSWKAPLAYLNLGSNHLKSAGLALEVIALLKHNALSLRSLDLSNNGLECQGYQFTDVLLGSLVKNTCLRHLNLSENEFSFQCIERVLDGLNRSDSHSGMAFLRFEKNTPPLTESQQRALNDFTHISRPIVLQRYLNDLDRTKSGEIDEIDALDDGSLTPLREGQPTFAKKPPLERKSSEHSESMFSASDATTAASDDGSRRPRKGENMITVLFSAPLVFRDEQNNLRPFAKLDFDMERELLWQCLKEARRDIELFFDNATHHRLLTAKAKRCSCLHYSGHGHHTHLPFENGKGGPHWLEVDVLRTLIEQNDGAPFKFVFVSACHSFLAGETFADAGVPHVVCCQQESEIKDAAALAFTRQFYLALAVGHTVKQSFDQGCKAVRATPNLRNAEDEMKKFILLPKNGNHDEAIFDDAKPLREWPRTAARSRSLQKQKSRRKGALTQDISRSRSIYLGGSRSSELSVRNMMQEDPSPTPPQFFLGREVDMYHVLNAVLMKRLVSVVGEKGLGRSSLVYALCHYVNERRSTIIEIDRIFFVRATQSRGSNRFVAVLQELLKRLMQDGRVAQQRCDNIDRESLIQAICKALNRVKALIVIDRTEFLEGSDEQQDLVVFLSNLFQETKTQHVRVLLTGLKPLGIPTVGGVPEQPYRLGPLNFHNTARLFGNLCPHLHTPADRRRFVDRIVTDSQQGDLLPDANGATGRTKILFQILGNGIPSQIEKAAFSISPHDIGRLGTDDGTGTFAWN